MIAGSLPGQNDTYTADMRDKNIVENNFSEQASILSPHIDFFYLDVLSSGREIEIALKVTQKFNKPVLVGIHIK